MTTKNTEGGHTKEVKEEPKHFTPDQVLRLVTEVIHDVKPQPDPAVIKDILNALQAKLQAKPEAKPHEEK